METFKKSKFNGAILFAFMACLLIFNCRTGSKKAGEKIMENAIENATGKDAKVDIQDEKAVIQTGDSRIEVNGKATIWPGEIPGNVPEFKFGKIEAVTTSNVDGTNSWTIAFKSVQDGFLEKYEQMLKEKGFETTLIKTGDKGGSIIAETKIMNVFLMGGEGNVAVSVSLKKSE